MQMTNDERRALQLVLVLTIPLLIGGLLPMILIQQGILDVNPLFMPLLVGVIQLPALRWYSKRHPVVISSPS